VSEFEAADKGLCWPKEWHPCVHTHRLSYSYTNTFTQICTHTHAHTHTCTHTHQLSSHTGLQLDARVGAPHALQLRTLLEQAAVMKDSLPPAGVALLVGFGCRVCVCLLCVLCMIRGATLVRKFLLPADVAPPVGG